MKSIPFIKNIHSVFKECEVMKNKHIKTYDKKAKKFSSEELFLTGGLLAVVGGFLDAYTYILRGGVFANAQTGNIVLLAVNIAKGDFYQAGLHIIPILAFALGVYITEIIKSSFRDKMFIKCEHFVILIEIALLFTVGFIPLSVSPLIVNVTISFICSIQVNSFRKIEGVPYASTMCTGNLRSCFVNLFDYTHHKNREAFFSCVKYMGIILLFIIGACIGTVLSKLIGYHCIWFCDVILTAVFLICTIRKD